MSAASTKVYPPREEILSSLQHFGPDIRYMVNQKIEVTDIKDWLANRGFNVPIRDLKAFIEDFKIKVTGKPVFEEGKIKTVKEEKSVKLEKDEDGFLVTKKVEDIQGDLQEEQESINKTYWDKRVKSIFPKVETVLKARNNKPINVKELHNQINDETFSTLQNTMTHLIKRECVSFYKKGNANMYYLPSLPLPEIYIEKTKPVESHLKKGLKILPFLERMFKNRQNKELTPRDIFERCNKSNNWNLEYKYVREILNALSKEGILEKLGNRRNVSYKLADFKSDIKDAEVRPEETPEQIINDEGGMKKECPVCGRALNKLSKKEHDDFFENRKWVGLRGKIKEKAEEDGKEIEEIKELLRGRQKRINQLKVKIEDKEHEISKLNEDKKEFAEIAKSRLKEILKLKRTVKTDIAAAQTENTHEDKIPILVSRVLHDIESINIQNGSEKHVEIHCNDLNGFINVVQTIQDSGFELEVEANSSTGLYRIIAEEEMQ